MKYKLVDRYNILSSASQKVTPEGRPVSNFTAWLDAKSEEYRISQGWYELVDVSEISSTENLPNKNYRYAYTIHDNVIHAELEEYAVEQPAFNMLKTALRKNMVDAGLGDVLNEYLASNSEAKLLWDECIVLESDSSFIVNTIQMIVSMGLKTEAELHEILEKSKTNLIV